MTIKIEIVSKEIVKPLQNDKKLNTYKLSLLDQIAPLFYIPIVLFYSNPKNDTNQNNTPIVVDNLKSSLSQTLSTYYPLAGTISNDMSFVELGQNDGVQFTEARVHAGLSSVLEKPDTSLVQRLLPFDPYSHGGNGAPLAVQSNEFDCGGIAVGVCISHKIADGTTLSNFLSAWSSYACGVGTPPPPPRLDAAEIFPPREIRLEMIRNLIQEGKIVARRFVFGAPGLARLRAEVGSKATRVEAVTALISKAAIGTNESESQSSVIMHVVNLRPRTVNPVVPESAIGNIWSVAVASVSELRDQSLGSLAAKVREEIRKRDREFTEKLMSSERFVEALNELGGLSVVLSEGVVPSYKFSSWVRFPIYEVNLGVGKPAWACTSATPIDGAVILMGDKCGDGIEAWVNLEEQHMSRFETDLELLSFASLAPGS